MIHNGWSGGEGTNHKVNKLGLGLVRRHKIAEVVPDSSKRCGTGLALQALDCSNVLFFFAILEAAPLLADVGSAAWGRGMSVTQSQGGEEESEQESHQARRAGCET